MRAFLVQVSFKNPLGQNITLKLKLDVTSEIIAEINDPASNERHYFGFLAAPMMVQFSCWISSSTNKARVTNCSDHSPLSPPTLVSSGRAKTVIKQF
jgi:hypothetical protein